MDEYYDRLCNLLDMAIKNKKEWLKSVWSNITTNYIDNYIEIEKSEIISTDIGIIFNSYYSLKEDISYNKSIQTVGRFISEDEYVGYLYFENDGIQIWGLINVRTYELVEGFVSEKFMTHGPKFKTDYKTSIYYNTTITKSITRDACIEIFLVKMEYMNTLGMLYRDTIKFYKETSENAILHYKTTIAPVYMFHDRLFKYYSQQIKDEITTILILNRYKNDMPVYPDCSISELPLELLFIIFDYLVRLHDKDIYNRLYEYTKHKLI